MSNRIHVIGRVHAVCMGADRGAPGARQAAVRWLIAGLALIPYCTASAQSRGTPVRPSAAVRASAGRSGRSAPARSASVRLIDDHELGAVPARLDFGAVCSPGGLLQSITTLPIGIVDPPPFTISTITVTSMTVTGSGFSLLSPPAVPFQIHGSTILTFNVGFSPTAVGPATGALTVLTDDPSKPPLVIPLTGTGVSPAISATANTFRTPTLTFGSVTSWTVTITNPTSTPCWLHALPHISGSGGAWQTVLPSSYFFLGRLIRDIEIPPGGVNTDLTVKFTSSITVRTTKAVGTLTLTSNDLARPSTSLFFGAEVVAPGMRVIVVGPDGNPLPLVDSITLKSSRGKVNTHVRNIQLTTIDPPDSWKRIQYHYMATLDPAADGNDYELRAQVGNKTRAMSFTLSPGEFKELVITLQ